MKKVVGVYSAPRAHWVGDGFPVRSLFSYQNLGRQLSPFLLLDYAGPKEFAPAAQPRGVGRHPHRGFETVTIAYRGEVAHRDSTGQGGVIGPGDVQWMTAGSGILHEEFHSQAFTREGGTLEMVQLWVNLPAAHKMTEPGYQAISARDIPEVSLAEGVGSLRAIAGEYAGQKGPARTFSPMQVWDLRLTQGGLCTVSLPEGWNTVVLLRCALRINGETPARDAQLLLLDSAGSDFTIEADSDALVLLLSGEPIAEPVIGHGPFVMNSEEEIARAIDDFNRGRFAQLSN
jgi:hypothetical protein